MKHLMRLHPRPFRDIAEGRKTWEFRLNDEKRRGIHIGDEVEFDQLIRSSSFAELLDMLPAKAREGLEKETWMNALRQHYSEEEERAFGVVAMGFHLK